MPGTQPRAISLWIKLPFTILVLAIIWNYLPQYGVANFLWFSDIALFLLCIELWVGSGILVSMVAVGVLLYELGWCVVFLTKVVFADFTPDFGVDVFRSQLPAVVRALSLFHLVLPVVTIWLLFRLGYDRRALKYQSAFGALVLVACFLFTDPQRDINWAFGLGNVAQTTVPPLTYLVLYMIATFFITYWPSHWFLCRLCERGHLSFIPKKET
jgi:hypothetical protein